MENNTPEPFTHVELTHSELNVAHITDLITDPKCGAISLFVGTTRDLFDGKEVVSLEYEAYEGMAQKEMLKLAQEARQQWPLEKIAIVHRLGRVGVAEASIVVGVSSVHRVEALSATSFIMDTIKARVPVWKREIYSDGSASWKENKECSWRSTQ